MLLLHRPQGLLRTEGVLSSKPMNPILDQRDSLLQNPLRSRGLLHSGRCVSSVAIKENGTKCSVGR